MKACDRHEVLALLCGAVGKWGLFISLPDPTWINEAGEDWIEGALAAVPWLSLEEHTQIIADGYGYFLFDSEEELDRHYHQVRGDDPNDVNPYSGSVRVYALTATPDGNLCNENT